MNFSHNRSFTKQKIDLSGMQPKVASGSALLSLKAENRYYRRKCGYLEQKLRSMRQKIHVLEAERDRNSLEDMMTSKDFLTEIVGMFTDHEASLKAVMERHRNRLNDLLERLNSLMSRDQKEFGQDSAHLDREKWRKDAFERFKNMYDFFLDSDLSVVEEKDEKRFVFEAALFQQLANLSSSSGRSLCDSRRTSLACSGSETNRDQKDSLKLAISDIPSTIAESVKTRRRTGSMGKCDDTKRSRIARPRRIN